MTKQKKNQNGKRIGGIAALIAVIVCALFGIRLGDFTGDDTAEVATAAKPTAAQVTGIGGADEETAAAAESNLKFANNKTLRQHYEKHGVEMGFASAEEYLAAANAVVANPNALHKLEKEDNDHIYYLEETNEIVFVSQKGVIRTYFCPDSGKAYFDRQ